MTVSEHVAHESNVQFTLTLTDAVRLRAVLPGLLRALADRDGQSSQQRARRREAYVAIEGLMGSLDASLPDRPS